MPQVSAVQYAPAREGSVAYRTCGSTPPDIVLVSDWFSHVDQMWEPESPFLPILEQLSGLGRLVTFDKRGVGMSDPVALSALPTLEDWVDDVRAVLDDVRSGPAWIIGKGAGAPMALMFAAAHPGAVAGLMLVNAWARLAWAEDFELGVDSRFQARLLEETYLPDGALELLAGEPIGPDVVRWWHRYIRNAASPRTARTMRHWLFRVDVRSVLGSISCPVLVVARRDAWIGSLHARYLCDRIPGARLVELPGSADLLFTGDTDRLVDEAEQFITGASARTHARRFLATVLYTDLVGSTTMATGLGDRSWRKLLDEHDRAVRHALREHYGHEVKHTGDGFLATFDGPARAIRCAASIRDALAALGLQVRIGVHAGEVERRGGDIGGIAVHVGARVQAAAEPDEILVSRTVRDLVAGSGISLSDRGVHRLKGVPEEWQLYAVDAV